jgi:hypothetical protein
MINNICHILRFGSEYPSRGDPTIGKPRYRPWAGDRGTEIPIRTAKICQIFFLAYSTIIRYILNSLPLISMEIYIITTVTTFLQQRMNYNFIHNGKMKSS